MNTIREEEYDSIDIETLKDRRQFISLRNFKKTLSIRRNLKRDMRESSSKKTNTTMRNLNQLDIMSVKILVTLEMSALAIKIP